MIIRSFFLWHTPNNFFNAFLMSKTILFSQTHISLAPTPSRRNLGSSCLKMIFRKPRFVTLMQLLLPRYNCFKTLSRMELRNICMWCIIGHLSVFIKLWGHPPLISVSPIGLSLTFLLSLFVTSICSNVKPGSHFTQYTFTYFLHPRIHTGWL